MKLLPRLTVLLTLLATTGTAAAQAKGGADAHFKRGVELYRDNDFSAALIEFQRAYDTDARFQVLYNVAEAQYQLQDYAGALQTFLRYLGDGGKKVPPARRASVEREIDKLRKRVARLTVLTSEPGAAVTVDDVAAGTTPLADSLVVSAGRRRVIATLAGRQPVTQIVELAGGDVQTITLQIPAPPPQQGDASSRRPFLDAPVIAWFSTGALAAGAIVTGSLALVASSDLKAQLAKFPGEASAIASAHQRTFALALSTDILAATAAAGAGVSIFLTVRGRQADAAPSARLVVYPGGAGIAGAF